MMKKRSGEYWTSPFRIALPKKKKNCKSSSPPKLSSFSETTFPDVVDLTTPLAKETCDIPLDLSMPQDRND